MTKVGLRRLALTGLLSFGLMGTAFAQPPATGLGQSWPNTTDVSANPNWHAYVFVLGGIKYVQTNDLNGIFPVEILPEVTELCVGELML